MSITSYAPREEYIGTGSLAAYTFDFKITKLTDLTVLVIDTTRTVDFKVRGDDVTDLSSVVFDAVNGGGTVTLAANLPLNYKLFLFLTNDEPEQLSEFSNKRDFTLKRIENALDSMMTAVQSLTYKMKRAITIDDRITNTQADAMSLQLPMSSTNVLDEDNRGKVLQIGSDNKSIVLGPSLAGGGALPPGGATGASLEKLSPADGDADWNDHVYSGVSRYGVWSSSGLADTISKILNIVYTPPTISLTASGSGTIREKGASVASTLLTATIAKLSNDIAQVRFYLSPSTVIDTQSSGGAIPSGGVNTYTYSTPFTNNVSFFARVDDVSGGGGPTTVTSNTVTFNFVYPYYYGAGAAGLGAAVAGLTKDIIASTATVARTIVASNGQKMYFAYPQAYGALTSILDASNFETIGSWTQSTVSITGLDATSQSYYVYESNSPVVAGSYLNTFKR